MTDEPEHIGKTEARAGTTTGMMRYVLFFGLLLTLVAFIVILTVYMRG